MQTSKDIPLENKHDVLDLLSSTYPLVNFPCVLFVGGGVLVLVLAGVDRAELVGFVHVYFVSYFFSLQRPWSGLGAHFGDFVLSPCFKETLVVFAISGFTETAIPSVFWVLIKL